MWQAQSDYPILVPRRADNGRRDENWGLVKSNVWRGCTVFEGHDETDQPFNISRARNQAAAEAGDWDIAVFADADSFVSPDALDRGIRLAAKTRQAVLPHNRWVNVPLEEIPLLLEEGYLMHDPDRTRYMGTKSSIVIVPREAYKAVNGYDERFVGWGYEDYAFHLALDLIHGPVLQMEGDVYHLAHDRPQADTNRSLDVGYIANTNHYRNLYKRARDATQLRRVIAKNRVTL